MKGVYVSHVRNLFHDSVSSVPHVEHNPEAWQLGRCGLFRLAIHHLLEETTTLCRTSLPKQIYSKELVELIFVQPYCKIQFVVDAGIAQRQTAADYLKALEEIGGLKYEKAGREKLFSNPALLELLKEP